MSEQSLLYLSFELLISYIYICVYFTVKLYITPVLYFKGTLMKLTLIICIYSKMLHFLFHYFRIV